ncbi:TetR/AcrR family transcriptional regulator [Fructilactobacillus sp. Tb1]|uniref:TetR/AcrR family transcriptional regulator n=1 Tax=Fructilactobacillus sp. Tb1 TaxID=3422304 RepID=UPI003D2E0853
MRQNTKVKIAKALIDEVAIIPLSEINVSNLINESGVSRKSFYNHFDGLDSVSDYTIEMVNDSLDLDDFMQIDNTEELVTRGFEILTNAIYKHRDEIKILYTSDLSGRWMKFLITTYSTIVKEVVFANYNNKNIIPKSAAITVYVYTMIALIKDWITQPIPVKPVVFRKYLAKVLKTAPEDLIYGPHHKF